MSSIQSNAPFIILPNVIVLSVIMMSDVMPSFTMLYDFTLIYVMMSVVALSFCHCRGIHISVAVRDGEKNLYNVDASAYLTLCVTVERYVAVCLPLKARCQCYKTVFLRH